MGKGYGGVGGLGRVMSGRVWKEIAYIKDTA